jgi:hypothetical protein
MDIAGNLPWDQNRFEELLAKWVAACDQPFSAVEEPEFRDLLGYVHIHSGRVLRIPNPVTVQRRVLEMGVDVEQKLKDIFAVGLCHY